MILPARWMLCVGSLLILAGCSGENYREGFGMIQGTITLDNKSLGGGSIHFFQDQEKVASFMIRPDGTYSAEVPIGQIKVAIETLSVKYHDREAVLKVMKENGFDVDVRKPDSPAFTGGKVTYVEIPERYSDPEKSGLACNVTRGRQTCNFDLVK